MTFVAHVVEFLLILGVVLGLGLSATFLLARAYVRRHWRLVRGHVATRGVLAGFAALSAWREHSVARTTPEQRSSGGTARVRRRLWVAVEDAETAVAQAEERQAPVAELPSVCRSLRTVAGELDALLRAQRRLPRTDGTDALRQQVAEVIGAARDVQAAAVRAGSDATEPQVRALVGQARDEVDIVSAALRRLRSLSQVH